MLTFAPTESKVGAMSKGKTKMGRPPKSPAEKMSHRVCVRLTPEQFQRLVNHAKQAGLSLSAFIQSRLEE
jgi:predicted HicB family RNase H-like nuclease